MNDFFARIFEVFYTPAANDLFQLNIYSTVGLILLLLPLLGVIIWYYLWDNPRKVRVINWLAFAALVAFLVMIAAFLIPYIQFQNEGLDYLVVEYLAFVGWSFILAFLVFFLFSAAFKWWSNNQRRNPF